ncbi:MAG: hypothetical protein ACRD3Q_07390 [Terriglobales bacterium]
MLPTDVVNVVRVGSAGAPWQRPRGRLLASVDTEGVAVDVGGGGGAWERDRRGDILALPWRLSGRLRAHEVGTP